MRVISQQQECIGEGLVRHIALLKNPIRKYDWGSKTAIPELLGEKPDGDPHAELWLGAHPSAPSAANINDRWIPLTELIEADPESMLGMRSIDKYSKQLPFLFKVLAAASPLSIQAHPGALQAKEGFSRETAAGIPIGSENRNYKDENHKPECICALTPFWVLNGFRAIREILFYLGNLCPNQLRTEIADLTGSHTTGALKRFFQTLMMKPTEAVASILEEALRSAKRQDVEDPVFSWMIRLYKAYPKDIGVLAPALLNLVLLKPGEALYLSSGRLHAYLDGVGMELMANSDNVLRGGLTPKHVDVSELLRVLEFEETIPEILKPIQDAPGIRRYITPAEEFVLSEITVDGSIRFENRIDAGVEILFCIQGRVRAFDGSDELWLGKGMSMIVPASVKGYGLEGDAIFYRASIGKNKRT